MPKKAAGSKSEIAKTKLLEAGAALFFDHGYDSVSVDEITSRADVARGLLFHYFNSKLDFYVEVYSRFVADLHRQRIAATESGSPEQRLRKFIRMHMEVFRQRGEAHTYHVRGGLHARVVAVSEESRQEGVLLLLSFFSSSTPPLLDKLMCRAWLDLMDNLISAWIDTPELSQEGVVDVAVELFHEAMGRAHMLVETPASESPAPIRSTAAGRRKRGEANSKSPGV